MKLALVSMPWSAHARPSAAVGALAAYVRQQEPSYEVSSSSEYVRVAEAMGFGLYGYLAENAYSLGELLYMRHLYPQQDAAIRERFLIHANEIQLEIERGSHPHEWKDAFVRLGSPEAVYAQITETISSHLTEVAERLAQYDVVGLTTCFGQLFANLVVCERVKRLSPKTVFVLGGSTVSARVGPSVLAQYPFVDYIIQGEGERPLIALLRALVSGSPMPNQGVLSREGAIAPKAPALLWEVDRLGDLPIPDYDEYAALADEKGIEWALPVEGSRGCWWDRTKRANNAKATCYFCNLNVQWKGYREKTVDRVVDEVRELVDRYATTRIYFLDNIIRTKGIVELAENLSFLNKDLEFFYEMRANVRPFELVKLWEAGLGSVQFGIEGLSSSVLRRIGKGTRAIQNLEVMKIAFELGIENRANLITDFPGSTQEEVEETRRNILQYALIYEPLSCATFRLGVDSTVETLQSEFPIANIRNAESLRAGLPEEVWRGLSLFDLDYDATDAVDWSPVREACRVWRARQREVEGPLLTYHDGGTFLRVADQREDYYSIVLRGFLRDLYMFCMEIRSHDQIVERFQRNATDKEIGDALRELVDARLVFQEGNKYLSLAIATSTRVAAQRILAMAKETPPAKEPSGGRALPIVG